jgi:hypothetical protein
MTASSYSRFAAMTRWSGGLDGGAVGHASALPKALREIHKADTTAVPAIDVLGDVGAGGGPAVPRRFMTSNYESTS